MYEVGDSISYDMTINNASEEDYMIDEDTFKTDSEYIEYSLKTNDNSNIVKAKSSKDVTLTATYKKEVEDNLLSNNKFNASNNLKLSLNTNDKEKYAYNNATIKFNMLGEDTVFTSNTSKVLLEEVSLVLDVSPVSSFGGTVYNKGSESNYVAIDRTIGYVITVNNYENIEFNSIQISNSITGVVNIDSSNIKYFIFYHFPCFQQISQSL